MAANLVRLSKAGNHPQIPLAVSTLYKWRHLQKFPQLFVELGGAVFIDLSALQELIENGRQSKRIKGRSKNA
jgi:hypothetical protein